MLARLSNVRTSCVNWWTALSGLSSDAVLYLLSAAFALVLGWRSDQAAQWQWGYLAMGPYALAALLAFVLARYVVRRHDDRAAVDLQIDQVFRHESVS